MEKTSNRGVFSMGLSGGATDPKDFEATAIPHFDACYNLALRLTGNKGDAEDLVQEAYLRAFRFFHRFEQGTNFKAWIFRVLYNIFLNEIRKRSSRSESLSSPNLEFLSERMTIRRGGQRTNDPERAAISNQITEALLEALNSLPEEFRSVVHLADIEGFAYKEIASIVGCPMGTVMSRLHRGRKLLREVFLHYGREGSGEAASEEEKPAEEERLDSELSENSLR
jgi:RNA polymerase sigma-70 factor (ECF subfamily)